jgi:hypothetical protein
MSTATTPSRVYSEHLSYGNTDEKCIFVQRDIENSAIFVLVVLLWLL